jgi:hypothetical protein
MKVRVEVVEAAGKQIHIYRRQFETRITQVHRAINGRRMFNPLRTKPVFDSRHGVDDALLQVENRAGQRRSEVGNHACFLGEWAKVRVFRM